MTVVTLDDIRAKLVPYQGELKRLGVTSLAVFGSTARHTATPSSDVDVLVKFQGPATFDRYMELKLLLERVLGHKVDLVTEAAVRPELRQHIERESVRVA